MLEVEYGKNWKNLVKHKFNKKFFYFRNIDLHLYSWKTINTGDSVKENIISKPKSHSG